MATPRDTQVLTDHKYVLRTLRMPGLSSKCPRPPSFPRALANRLRDLVQKNMIYSSPIYATLSGKHRPLIRLSRRFRRYRCPHRHGCFHSALCCQNIPEGHHHDVEKLDAIEDGFIPYCCHCGSFALPVPCLSFMSDFARFSSSR